jgi:hypothetical protein
MKRLFALALVVSIGNASVAFAGESLLAAGTRHVQQITVESSSVPARPATAAALPVGQPATPSLQADGGRTLSKSSMSKGTKVLIYAGLIAGFVVSAYEIDKHVLNLTPSSLGTRKD